ncbi:hypothetical protein F5Y04DRAFT_41848 [Hypomontagnella monticulosa]|nr:hypothetical protein F5Y04DRAFT_41848 [Hypomontagnella monticulosa]
MSDMEKAEAKPDLTVDHLQAGITIVNETFTMIDFSSALDFIKGKLTDEQVRDHWADSVLKATRTCTIISRDNNYAHQVARVSTCWFSILFLNSLWSLLFGNVNGNSPWYHSDKGLHLQVHGTNGSADSMLDVASLAIDMNKKKAKPENLVREELGRYFPMRIHMPKVITPIQSVPPKKRPAEDVVGPLNVKRSH